MENNHQSSDRQPVAQPQPTATPAARHYIRPRAHVTETPTDFLVQVEMPGVDRQGLEITLENGELTLVGHRATSDLPPDAELLYRESRPVDFRRVFEVDASIDTARISAGVEQGLLTLTLPKAEAAKPRRIEINGLN